MFGGAVEGEPNETKSRGGADGEGGRRKAPGDVKGPAEENDEEEKESLKSAYGEAMCGAKETNLGLLPPKFPP